MTTETLPVGVYPRPSFWKQFATAFVVATPFVAVTVAIFLSWHSPEARFGIMLFGILWFLTVNAITCGFHRSFTHRSVQYVPWLKRYYLRMGQIAVQGPADWWAKVHILHHHKSDQIGDPHSPWLSGNGFWGSVKGVIHAHVGWMFTEPDVENEDDAQRVRYVTSDEIIVTESKLFPFWAVMSFLLPGIIEWIAFRTWKGLFMGILWGGFVRVGIVHHLTWSVNSVGHKWGQKLFHTGDESRNVPFIAFVLVFGLLYAIATQAECYHNSHHGFQRSARFGHRWWEIDVGWIVIRILKWCGLARHVVVPTKEQIEAKRIRLLA